MKFKKLLKRKFIPFLCAFLVVPFLFVSVFAVRFNTDNSILNDPYGKFIARFYGNNGWLTESGDVYKFEYMPSQYSGVGIFNFSQIIEDTYFNRRYPDEYGVRYIAVRSPLAVNKLEEGDHIDISFNLVNVPDAYTLPNGQIIVPTLSEFRYFQPTTATVQIFGKINGVDKTWVYTPTEWYGELRSLPSADRDVYPPDTEKVYIWDEARFEINLAVPMKNDANYPANTDELIYSIDFIELSFARQSTYFPNDNITIDELQYTNDAMIQFTNFVAEIDVSEANSDGIIDQIATTEEKILQYLQVNGLPEFDYDDIDGALSADADVDELASDATSAQSNNIAKGLSYLNNPYWSAPLLFMKSVFSSFLFPNSVSGGIFNIILSVLIPVGLFATVVSVFADISSFNSRSKRNKNKPKNNNNKKNKKG